MTFTEALKSGLPMRRVAWTITGPRPTVSAETDRATLAAAYVFLRILVANRDESPWIWISTGTPLQLSREDYLADDWEVLDSFGDGTN